MGMVQSLPVPGPLMTAKMSPFLPAPVRQFLRQRILPLAGLIEDLPNPANRVTLGPNGEAKLTHRYRQVRPRPAEAPDPLYRQDPQEGRRGVLPRSASSSPTSTWPISAAPSASATIRPTPSSTRIAACTANPDIFAVDGSFLPTSLGVGPGLTIMANALRVAAKVAAEV